MPELCLRPIRGERFAPQNESSTAEASLEWPRSPDRGPSGGARRWFASMVAARCDLPNRPNLISGQQWRRPRRFAGIDQPLGLSRLVGHRSSLALPDLFLADARLRLRHF